MSGKPQAGSEPPLSADVPTDPGASGDSGRSHGTGGEAAIKAFLIADIRGYTLFTQTQGDEAAAKLAAKFAGIAREAVEAHDGSVIELRGDEALVVFDSPRQAIRAAVDLQDRFVEETLSDPSLPLAAGVGLDAGEAVPVEGGFRGGALNLAARLCGQAGPGEILASQEVVHLARRVEGVAYADRGEVSLKGLSEPVRIIRVSSENADAADLLAPVVAAPPAPAGPHGGPHRRRRRRLLVAALAVVVLAAVALPLALSSGGGTTRIEPNSVGRIDLVTGDVMGQTSLVSAPGAVASGAGAVWVAEPDENKVLRLNNRGAVVDAITVGIDPSWIAVGDGSVWVVNAGGPSVSRISPATNQVVQTITVGNGPDSAALGDGAVWVTNRLDGTVSQIDAQSGAVTRTIPLADTPSGIAVAGPGIWVAGTGTGTLAQIDSTTGATSRVVHVGNGPGTVASGDGSLWVSNTLDGTVSRVDPTSGSVTATIPVGAGPAGIAFSPGAVWVASEFVGTVTRVDPAGQGAERTFRLGSEPQGATVSGGTLWVATRGVATSHVGGTLSILGDHVPATVDPAVAYDDTVWRWLILTNDGLVGFKRVGGADGGTLVPDLAVALSAPTDQGRTYTYRLRSGITYSNGRPVRASDFRTALERGFEIKGSPVPGLYGDLVGAPACARVPAHCDLSAGIVADDSAGTVTFHLSTADTEFPDKLALPLAFAVPAGTPGKDIGTTPLPATGPYMVQAYSPKIGLTLVRNPRFHVWSQAAQPNGNPDRITWRFSVAADAAVSAVEAGRVDWIEARAPAGRTQELLTRYAGVVHVFPRAQTDFWAMNTEVPPFNDIRVRRALNFAVDRRTMVSLYGPEGARITCQILPPNFPGYEPYCPYTVDPGPGGRWAGPDLAQAHRLITASGTSGTAVRVWVTNALGETYVQEARYLTSLLGRLGYRATVHLLPGNVYFRAIYDTRTQAQISAIGWIEDYPAASNFIANQWTCASLVHGKPDQNGNIAAFCNPAIDRQVRAAEAAQATAPERAGRMWTRVEHEIVDQAPAVWFANPEGIDVLSSRVGNYQRSPQWGILLDQLWVR